jgi:hypothetical protein
MKYNSFPFSLGTSCYVILPNGTLEKIQLYDCAHNGFGHPIFLEQLEFALLLCQQKDQDPKTCVCVHFGNEPGVI